MYIYHTVVACASGPMYIGMKLSLSSHSHCNRVLRSSTLCDSAEEKCCGAGIIRTLLFQDGAVPLPYDIQVVELIQVSFSTSSSPSGR